MRTHVDFEFSKDFAEEIGKKQRSLYKPLANKLAAMGKGKIKAVKPQKKATKPPANKVEKETLQNK